MPLHLNTPREQTSPTPKELHETSGLDTHQRFLPVSSRPLHSIQGHPKYTRLSTEVVKHDLCQSLPNFLPQLVADMKKVTTIPCPTFIIASRNSSTRRIIFWYFRPELYLRVGIFARSQSFRTTLSVFTNEVIPLELVASGRARDWHSAFPWYSRLMKKRRVQTPKRTFFFLQNSEDKIDLNELCPDWQDYPRTFAAISLFWIINTTGEPDKLLLCTSQMI